MLNTIQNMVKEKLKSKRRNVEDLKGARKENEKRDYFDNEYMQ